MLSIFLTEELEIHEQSSTETLLVYYFCSVEEGRNSAASILRGLLWQITDKRPELTKYLLPPFDTPEKAVKSAANPEVLWTLFVKLMQASSKGTTFIVLDGLDECDKESQRWLAAKVITYASMRTPDPNQNGLKLVVVSREISTLKQISAQVNLDPDNDHQVISDIHLLVSTRVQELSRLVGFNQEFRQSVEKELLERAEGTFLWIGLVMLELLEKDTCIEIEETLRSLPRGLPAVYSRILGQIEDKRKEECSQILSWVALAVRPMSLEEIAAAVGTQPLGRLTLENVIEEQIQKLCRGFLKVQDGKVNLIHQSARD